MILVRILQSQDHQSLDEPSAKVLGRIVECFLRAVPRVYFGVYDMALGKKNFRQIMDMRWKALEAGLGAHEAMNVY